VPDDLDQEIDHAMSGANAERSGAERPTGALSCVSCGTHEKGSDV
jgi:hypothetical protein